MKNDIQSFFEDALQMSLGKKTEVNNYVFTSGGCINNTAKLITDETAYFIKWNKKPEESNFSVEANGLEILSKTDKVKTPEIIGFGQLHDKNYLLLEFIESKLPDSKFWEDLGVSLSGLHKNSNQYFGLDHDNFIGSLPQKNSFKTNWVDFFIENRLDVQIDLAYNNGHISKEFLKKFKNTYSKLPGLLPEEKPALLHGDLWSGNFLVTIERKTCLIDPAVYYGNREVDISFTKLFGGFDNMFYNIYHECFPLLPGFEQRVDIYNLYYLLVHVNIFGASYFPAVESTIKSMQ